MNKLKIALIAGEHSGDILGADLMSALSDLAKLNNKEIEFRGVAGPKMTALGCQSYFDMDELAVMGIVEIVKRLPRLLKKRKQLVADLVAWQPDVVIGIDAPEFNLTLERLLKEQGIKTVHYVSPSVWAWRQSRVETMKQGCDLVLTLLPFEKQFYDKHQVPCEFVGHTMADQIPIADQQNNVREKLNLNPDDKVLGVLPGSRGSELKFLLTPFLQTAQQLQQNIADLKVLVPAVDDKRYSQIDNVIKTEFPNLKVTLSKGNARDVMAASDAVLLASGTAALETMLMKTPMVAAYKVGWVSYQIFSRLVKTPYFTLPNLLADKMLIKEFIQHDMTTDALYQSMFQLLSEPQDELKQTFTHMHQELQLDASKKAASAIWPLIYKNNEQDN